MIPERHCTQTRSRNQIAHNSRSCTPYSVQTTRSCSPSLSEYIGHTYIVHWDFSPEPFGTLEHLKHADGGVTRRCRHHNDGRLFHFTFTPVLPPLSWARHGTMYRVPRDGSLAAKPASPPVTTLMNGGFQRPPRTLHRLLSGPPMLLRYSPPTCSVHRYRLQSRQQTCPPAAAERDVRHLFRVTHSCRSTNAHQAHARRIPYPPPLLGPPACPASAQHPSSAPSYRPSKLRRRHLASRLPFYHDRL